MEIGVNYFNYFYLYVQNNLIFYILLLFFTCMIYFIVYKRYIISLIDPFALAILYNSICTADIIFMWHYGLIKPYFYNNYFLNEFMLAIGINFIKPVKKAYIMNNVNSYKFTMSQKNIFKFMYIISSIIYIIIMIFLINKTGILLLKDQLLKQNIMQSAGYFYYMILGLIPLIIYFLYYRLLIFKDKNILKKVYDYIVLCFLLLYLFNNGSKSALLTIIMVIFYIFIFNYNILKNTKIKKYLNKLIIYSIICIIIIFAIQFNTKNIFDVFNIIFYRIVATGDIYAYYYIPGVKFHGNIINGLMIVFYPIIYIFKTILRLFGFNVIEHFPKNIGLILYQNIMNTNIIAGPNSRLNAFGLYFFGNVGSLILSFCYGIVLSFVKNKFYYKCKTYFSELLYMIITIMFINGLTDISYSNSVFVMNFISLIIIYSISKLIISAVLTNKNIDKDKIKKRDKCL